MNRGIFMGKLVADPETGTIDGMDQCWFTIACTESWKDKSGKKLERVERIHVITYHNLAEICGKTLFSGRMVYVEGKLRTREYSGKDGVRQQVTEVDAISVIFLGAKTEAADAGEANGSIPF